VEERRAREEEEGREIVREEGSEKGVRGGKGE